jgi:hypothetical protein
MPLSIFSASIALSRPSQSTSNGEHARPRDKQTRYVPQDPNRISRGDVLATVEVAHVLWLGTASPLRGISGGKIHNRQGNHRQEHKGEERARLGATMIRPQDWRCQRLEARATTHATTPRNSFFMASSCDLGCDSL